MQSDHTAQVKAFYDATGNTLTVWFGNPTDEDISTMVEDDLIVMKDKTGRIVGIDKFRRSRFSCHA